MALNWSWSDKVGELTTSDRNGNIYVHNIPETFKALTHF